nr:hypothetical protein [Mycobacterium sp. E3298]
MHKRNYPYILDRNRQQKMKKYILQKDMPGCKKGTVFVHDTEDDIVGSLAAGCLKLAWTDKGNCQETAQYCGGSFILHASLKDDPEWFKEERTINQYAIEVLEKLIEKLKGE